jgi:hypothetical protein
MYRPHRSAGFAFLLDAGANSNAVIALESGCSARRIGIAASRGVVK